LNVPALPRQMYHVPRSDRAATPRRPSNRPRASVAKIPES
jgi:hypothetical protein